MNNFPAKNLRNVIFCTAIFLCVTTNLFAQQQVDEDEIKSVGGINTVQFLNYMGPYDKIESAASIRAIGGGLGATVSRSVTTPSQSGDRNRYYIIHAVGPEENGKRDADIMYIGAGAAVDHIANVRRIISGYLMAAYGYNNTDADTLAIFVTVYNAVYRNNLQAFTDKYKSVVIQNLTKENCGISLSYRDWPGHTELVIPLYNVARGGISTIDTAVISDQRVIESMREDDDRNIDARQNMVDIIEREADEANDRAQAAQQQAAQQQQQADQAKAEAQQQQQQAAQAQKDATQAQKDATQAQKDADKAQAAADKAQAAADKNPNDAAAQQKAQEAQQAAQQAQKDADEAKKDAESAKAAADRAQAAADEAKEAADKAQAAANKSRDTAATEQAEADKFQTDAQRTRADIAKDVQDVVREQAELAASSSVYGIMLTDDSRKLSALVQVNSKNGNMIRQSPVAFIRNRTAYNAGNGYVAIAGEASGNGAVKLVLIDPTTLIITKTSNETAAEDSVLVRDGNDFYCVIQDGSNYVVAKYDADMNLKLRSPVSVKDITPIYDTGSTLMVTGTDGKVHLLDKSNLNEVTE